LKRGSAEAGNLWNSSLRLKEKKTVRGYGQGLGPSFAKILRETRDNVDRYWTEKKK